LFLLASAYASRNVSSLQTWTYNPQNFQDVSAFALTYILRLRSCKSMDAFVISSLPSLWSETLQTAGLLRSTGVAPLRRYFEPIRHPLAFDRLPGGAGYTIDLLRRFRAGTRRASPVARHVLATVLSLPPRRSEGAASVRFRLPMLPSPSGWGLGLRGYSLSRPLLRSLLLRPGDSSPPRGRRCR
jgi:hypothetical protein